VNQFDLEAIAKELRDLGINGKSCKSLEEACDFAREIMHGKNNPHARLAFAVSFFQLPKFLHSRILERWNTLGQPTLNTLAPYTCFVLTIEVFFRIALAAHLIATERPSNQNDIAYLFYLPFCNVFLSSDRLHRRCAQLFMRPNQQFIWGPELKGALSEANSHFLNLPELERERGVIGFPHALPKENLIERLWPRNARGRLEKPSSDQSKAELHAELTKRLQQMRGEPVLRSNDPAALEQADTLTIERKVRRKRGNWWQVPKDMPDDG
jgi:hypothetical protein